jgi:hypothetical protein
LAQKLGQLEAVNRDLQLKYWANLKLLVQPCTFYAPASADDCAAHPARLRSGTPPTAGSSGTRPAPSGTCRPGRKTTGFPPSRSRSGSLWWPWSGRGCARPLPEPTAASP